MRMNIFRRMMVALCAAGMIYVVSGPLAAQDEETEGWKESVEERIETNKSAARKPRA